MKLTKHFAFLICIPQVFWINLGTEMNKERAVVRSQRAGWNPAKPTEINSLPRVSILCCREWETHRLFTQTGQVDTENF